MQRFRIFGGNGHVRFHHFPNERTVLGNQDAIGKLTFEIGVTLFDQRSTDLRGRHRCEPELIELVDLVPLAIAYAHGLVHEVRCGNVDHALLAPPNHLEAVIAVPDVASEERG